LTLTEISTNGGDRTVLFQISEPIVIRLGETTEVRLRGTARLADSAHRLSTRAGSNQRCESHPGDAAV
jgi:hypothetical protein